MRPRQHAAHSRQEVHSLACWILWHRGQHRAVGWPHLLLSAVAVRHRLTVVHDDRDVELVAEVTGQPMTWVVPAGTVP